MIYAEGLSFNLVKSHYFKKAVEFIGNFGRDYAPPSYHETKVTYPQKKVKKLDKVDLEKFKK